MDIQQLDGYESWRNESLSTVALKRGGEKGVESFLVEGHRVFHIRPDDRRLNQMEVAAVENDPFSNGLLSNLLVIETDRDAQAIKANPNQLSESDMVDLYKLSFRDFEARLASLSNLVTLTRILAVGREGNVGVKKIEAVEARIVAVDPIAGRAATNQRIPGQPSAAADPGPEVPIGLKLSGPQPAPAL